MKSHRHVEEDGRRRLLPLTSLLSLLLLPSNTVQAFQFGRIIGPSLSSSSSSSVVRPRRHNTIQFFAQEGASDNKDETSNIHQYIASQDPTWYQQYVVDILGQEYTESKLLQMNLEVATSLSFPKMEQQDSGIVQQVQASTDEIMDVAKVRERAEEQTRRQMMKARFQSENDRQNRLQKAQKRARQAAEEEAQRQMEERQEKLEARLQAQEQARLEAEEAKEMADEQVKRLEARLKAEKETNAAAEEARMLADEANRKQEEEAKAAAETTR